MQRTSLLPLCAAVAAIAGCGGSGGDPDADPAAIVPARAPVYLEATLDPEGETSDAINELSRKLAGEDEPGPALRRLIEREAKKDDPDFSYEQDVEPWLGDRVGIFVSSLNPSGQDADVALVAATEDADKAQEVLERELARREEGEPAPKVADRTYQDVEYKLETNEDEAVAIVDGFAVSGSEAAVKASIDATEGQKLSDADPFEQARDQVGDDNVGFGYVRVGALLGSLGPQGAAARSLVGQSGDTIAFALEPEKDAIRFETAALNVRGPAAGPGEVLETLPATAWLAGGTADVGGQLERPLQQVGQLGAFGGIDLEQILGQVEQQTGIDVREDLLSWMGDAGIFVQGTSASEAGGALVVQSKDPQKSADVVPKLARLIRSTVPGVSAERLRGGQFDAGVTLTFAQLPLPVHIVAAEDTFVIAVTDAALEAAFSEDEPLGSTPAFRDGVGRLAEGNEPAFFVDLTKVGQLADSAGAFEGENGADVRRVFEHLTTLVAGSRRDGDVQRGQVVVGVK